MAVESVAVEPAAAEPVAVEPVAAEPVAAEPPAPTLVADADGFEPCRRRAATGPVDRATAMCFYGVARADRRWEQGQRELEALVARPDATPWARLGLAVVLADRGDTEAAAQLMAPDVETFPPNASVGDRATLLANYGQWMRSMARFADAEQAFERLAQLGHDAGVPEIEATGQVELGYTMVQRGGDMVRALALYDAGIPQAIEHGSYMAATHGLRARAALWRKLDKFERARADYQQMLEMARSEDDLYVEVFALAAMVSLDAELLDARAEPMPPALRERVESTRTLAERAGQVNVLASLHCVDGHSAAAARDFREAVDALGRCAAAFDALDVQASRRQAQAWQAAHMVQAGEITQALALAEEVAIEARRLGLRGVVLSAGYVRVVGLWALGERPQALAAAAVLFDEIELFRDLQLDDTFRSGTLSMLSTGYYFVAGSLLRESSDDREALDLAFDTMERLRARSLLDGLRRSDSAPHDPHDPHEQRWRAVLDEIVAVQRSLLSSSLDRTQRRSALDQLADLERRERMFRAALDRSRHGIGELVVPIFSGLDDVQAALGPDEAVLSYQVADDFDRQGGPEGGAWLWSITRDAVRVYPIPESRVIARKLAFVGGLFARRDGRETLVMAQLHRDLVAPALHDLDPSIDRLVVVPDGALWSLPFAALRASPDAPPLVNDYAVSVVPSMTSWMQWRADVSAPSTGLLALAQPQLELGPAASQWRRGTLSDGVELGRLPRARDEIDTITEIWAAGPAHTEVGEAASEHFLKGSTLSSYGMLHFATHAVMDRHEPERSAVVLTPGNDGEDGLLQAREIVQLDLDGQVVVLSACSGASGAFVRGEGVMSLARAFLQAGAHAVVASRWPLADADALALFQRLYLHLDEGRALSDALALAQRDLIEQGAPAAAWAGVVVLGRGDLVLVPRPVWWPWRRVLLGLGALLCVVVAGVTWRRARHRSRPV